MFVAYFLDILVTRMAKSMFLSKHKYAEDIKE